MQAEWSQRPMAERGLCALICKHQGSMKPATDAESALSQPPADSAAPINTNGSTEHPTSYGRSSVMGGAAPEEDLALADATNCICGLLYAPLQLHLHRRKRLQVQLLQAEAATVTAQFNGEFAGVVRLKRSCADKLAELLDRVRSIQLDLQCSQMPAALPEAPEEDVQRHLRVSDSEVTSPKWLSEADR
jgi:hypothetical protein